MSLLLQPCETTFDRLDLEEECVLSSRKGKKKMKGGSETNGLTILAVSRKSSKFATFVSLLKGWGKCTNFLHCAAFGHLKSGITFNDVLSCAIHPPRRHSPMYPGLTYQYQCHVSSHPNSSTDDLRPHVQPRRNKPRSSLTFIH